MRKRGEKLSDFSGRALGKRKGGDTGCGKSLPHPKKKERVHYSTREGGNLANSQPA